MNNSPKMHPTFELQILQGFPKDSSFIFFYPFKFSTTRHPLLKMPGNAFLSSSPPIFISCLDANFYYFCSTNSQTVENKFHI